LVFKERSSSFESASSLVCVEEFSFSESACRRKATSLNKLPCGFVPRNLASLNLLADAGTGATEGISHSFKTERSDCLESASLQLCAEESIFLEPARRRRRKTTEGISHSFKTERNRSAFCFE
ncbi:hypothetical protein P4499_17565, partial [Geobacillus kaustophilus]|uniref:hypothetical protein n=1 Tax=Geobacillus kaustophilus TaxID=1462 RepID=UPI002E22E6CD|nr:hypothetical protein [Geobacillus kaustophilus]